MISYEPLYRTLESRHLPMNELSAKIGFAPTTLGACISRKESLTSSTIGKICEALNCSVEEVVENVPDGTVIEHKRTAIRTKIDSEKIVCVNWPKLSEDAAKTGLNDHEISRRLGKATNYIARKKALKHITLTTLQEIARVIGTDYKDYI